MELEADGRAAEEELFRMLYPSLRRYAAVAGSLSDDPDDLVQEALSRVLAHSTLIELEYPGAYLRRTISNIAINGARADAVRSRHLADIASESAVNDVYPSDLEELQRLPTEDRALLFLVDVEGVPFADAATIVGVTTVAARLRASRARRMLRTILMEES